ncbi:MAG: ATP-binding cassette domain-containing protein [Nitrospinaceae bacterium]|nr:ABC transporter ATP-binding protein [Nitrospinaceae bacterium]NIR56456.1 ABC transporter ATP-binding protein [Nitrospinaceae bacterium]NIS86917.1 ABC transporter ATP-binding protein [Nitrospinaceae bacterium]NIT83755.1 ABC transporter ATP-binding protein [Nitrospinaceae bacterium]NIU45958.1 ABC transporter ATP-binding protein [Nitrospinaceae bacterium]
MVRLEGITKSFGPKTVLQDCSLAIEEGERFVLLGRSGCGKTTLLRLIAGFDLPDRGRVVIAGQDMHTLPVERRPVGFIFQRHALFPHMKVYDNIAVGPRVRGLPETETHRQISELLELTRLTDLAGAWPGQLSGGESQRVALARAVINKPKLLLLDEPLSALDESLRQNLREELMDMQRAFGITFLFVTHDQKEAMSLADRMSILEGGSLMQVGTPQSLYDRPSNPFVAEFLGRINRLTGPVVGQTGNRVTLSLQDAGTVTALSERRFSPESPLGIYIRPERMRLQPEQPAGELNGLAGRVEQILFFGDHLRYRVKLKNGTHLNIQEKAPGRHEWRRDDPAVVVFDFKDVMIFSKEQE